MNSPSSADRRRAVGLAGHTGDIDTARQGLEDAHAPVRVAALRSLDRLDALSTDIIHAALGDSEPTVRVAALELASTRSEPAVDALLDDPEAMVVETAAWAMGERADSRPHVIDALAEISRDHDDPLVREAAVAALGAIGDHRGLAAVLDATTDKPAIRRRAVIALVAFDGPEVDAAWARARTDRDRQVRDAVEELLGPVDDE